MTGCKKNDERNSNEGRFFFEAAKNTLPVIKSSAVKNINSKSASAEDPWGIDNPLFLIYSMLREFSPENDDGSVGIDNIYRILYMAGTFFDDVMKRGDIIPEQHITAPFSLGYNDARYNVAINNMDYNTGSAVRLDGNTNHALHCHLREDAGGSMQASERGILQGYYNKATHDLKLDLLTFLDSDLKDIGFRIRIEGNDSTHYFTIKYVKYATNESYAYGVGHGVSKGAGNYFLFRFSAGIEDNLTINNAYYCIEATDSVDDLKVMNMAGVSEIIPECLAYKSIVDNLVPLTRADLPSSTADFNKGGTGIASEGSMFLKFNK